MCHDSTGNKLFDFIFSRSHEAIVIGVCGMRSADQDHRIVSEPIPSGSFLESGPEGKLSTSVYLAILDCPCHPVLHSIPQLHATAWMGIAWLI